METKIPQELIDRIIDEINAVLDIPFLNEKQERFLLSLVLSILLETLLKLKK